MAGHTPGPWQHVPDKWDRSEYRIETVRRWSVDPTSGIYVASANGPSNARLIAAAPDLLEACKMFVDACENAPSKTAAAVRMARAAIAKAEGN